ncbi:rhodanese-like domain-containing protein [Nesterenkonia suensis]
MTSADPATTLSAEQLRDMLAQGHDPLMLDVRTAAEHRGAHIPGSVSAPDELIRDEADTLAAALDEVDRPVVLLCQAGPRSRQARELLAAAGFTEARVLDGGLNGFRAAAGDDAVEIGEGPWAMERQVRMAAGSLVVAGLVGGRLLSPKARLLSGAIASGLIYSAASDTCGMAKVLARMPWNQDHGAPVSLEDVLAHLS